MNYSKQILILFGLLTLFYTLFLINDTYAKYKTDAEADTNISIARWSILVNNQDIKNNKDFSASIKPTFEGNENIASGIIAPTAEGYFDITIDHTNVDVSFSFDMILSIDPSSDVSDLIITGYTLNNGTIQTFPTNDYHLANNIMYNDPTKVRKYRFFVKWDDSATATMDNSADTKATSGQAIFKINTSFVQLAS